jgi:hypothetical protein
MAVHTAQNYALSVADALLYCAAVAMFIPFLQSWRAQRSAAGLFDTLEERLQGLIAAALQTSKSSSNEAVFHSNLALRLEVSSELSSLPQDQACTGAPGLPRHQLCL